MLSARSVSGRALSLCGAKLGAAGEPSQALLREYVPRRLKFGCLIEGADMEMGFGRQRPAQAFASQGRPTPGTKSPPGSSRRRIELGNLALGDGIGRALECDKDRSGCPAMLSATLAMAPIYSLRLTRRHKADRTAQAAAFELVCHAAHNPILPFCPVLWALLGTSPSPGPPLSRRRTFHGNQSNTLS